MNSSTQYTPRPGGTSYVSPEKIIYGTDGKCRWVYQPDCTARLFGLFKGKSPCVLFTVDEVSISSHQVKGNAAKEDVIHAFAVWVGGQSQPTLRFNDPRTVQLSAVKHIAPNPAKDLIRIRTARGGFSIHAAPAQFDFILNHLTRCCPQAKLTNK